VQKNNPISEYLAFLRRASGQAPLWWWILTVAVTILSLIFTLLGSTPDFVIHYWYIYLIGLMTMAFFGVTWGAFSVLQTRETAHLAQVAELQGTIDEQWTQKQKETQEIQDERDIPEVIKEMKNEYGNWLRSENIHTMTTIIQQDANWFVAKLKGKRSERLVRKAYKQWKSEL
jgi:hypothetical protein